MDAVKEMFPPFYIEYSKDYLTKEKLENERKYAKETYGDDFSITYKIGENAKMTNEELEKLNKTMINTCGAKKGLDECYKYKISIIIKGSKKEDPDSYSTMGYCKYDGVWYIVRV